jgi:hypothetical protein
VIKAKGKVVPNMWSQSGALPGPDVTWSVVAYRQARDNAARSKMKRNGFEPTERQIANAKRADQKLRKFSWETE